MLSVKRTDDQNVLRLSAPSDLLKYFVESFTAKDTNCYFHHLYRSKKWDGTIKFFKSDGTFLKGLLPEVLKLIQKNNWTVSFDKSIVLNPIKFTIEEIRTSLKGVQLYDDSQMPVIEKFLKYNFGLIKLPTASGKSFLEIATMNLYYSKGLKNQILIVPRASLVEQIYQDALSFSQYLTKNDIGRLDGDHKDWNKPVVIATWQSLKTLLQLDKNYGFRFEVLIQDEVHVSSDSAKIVKGIILSFQPKIKYGFSATIASKERNKLEYFNLSSLFGSILVSDTIQNLQSQGRISDAKVIVKMLHYSTPVEISDYHEYEDFLRTSEDRIKFLIKLVRQIQEKDIGGNIIILVRNVDVADAIYGKLKDEFESFLIKGSIKISDRINIKEQLKTGRSKCLIATEGTFMLGENVPNLATLILYQLRKSEIATIQTVGRVLRKSPGKTHSEIYDLCDDLTVKIVREDGEVTKRNYGKRHFKKRLETYRLYGFDDVSIERVMI